MAWTTDDLVAAVKRRAQLPDANGSLTDDDIIELGSEEMYTQVIPMITTAAEHYFIKEYNFHVFAGTQNYRIPPQVQAGTLFDVVLIDLQGRELGSIPQMPLQDKSNFGPSSGWGQPSAMSFCLEADQIVLLPTPSQANFAIRVRYIRRPNRMIAVSKCAKVDEYLQDIPSAGRTQFSFPSPLPAGMTDDKMDLVQGVPNFDMWATYVGDANPTINSFDVATAAIDPQFFEANLAAYVDGASPQPSYWCPQQTTCVVPLPDVFHPLLISLLTAQVLRSLGDFQGAAIEQETAEQRKQRIAATIEPRTRARGMKIISDSHPLRAANNRHWFWGQ